MKAEIYYHSSTGNTKKAAEAMAGALGRAARPMGGGSLSGPVDFLFLGCAVYATSDHDLAPEARNFISSLDPLGVRLALLFCTGFNDKAIASMRALLRRRGIAAAAEAFYCKGRFLLFNRGHPDAADLERAAAFARAMTSEGRT